MPPQENIFYTIYKGNDASPVKVFRQGEWALENGVSLRAGIIGKSHRIICRANGDAFTEFIAYPIEEMTPNPLDYFPLHAGETYNKTYRAGGLLYHLNLRVRPVLFQTMNHFLESVGKHGGLEVLRYAFDTRQPETSPAFTGIAVDIPENRFYTVHTYPEQGFSICSSSEVRSSVAVGTL
ncbi:MAG: DUF2617 family protein [Nitrospinales bacterium]